MLDRLNRKIDYMRISVTEDCNLRCCYCMPLDKKESTNSELSFEDILKICSCGARLGITKIKITGGEPLQRQNVTALISHIYKIDGIEEVTLTTNGVLLEKYLPQLLGCGVKKINVSVDSLNPLRYEKITGSDCLNTVLSGIKKAIKAGMSIKINCLLMEETKEEYADFVNFAQTNNICVRFIELMPIGCGLKFVGVDNSVVKEKIAEKFKGFIPLEKSFGNGPASYYGWKDQIATIGFISPIHEKFCNDCNRVRLNSNGFLQLCLGHTKGIMLTPYLQNEKELFEVMKRNIFEKPTCQLFQEEKVHKGKFMFKIGG